MRWLGLLLCPVLVLADTSDNLLGTHSSVTYNVRQQSQVYTFSYTTGTVVFNGMLPEYDPLNVLTLNWSMDVRMPCNNSIGGYCSDPNGPKDTLDAFLGVAGNGYAESRQVLDLQDYFTDWRTVSGSENYTTTDPLTGASLTVQGFDSGFWGGYYGPQFRSPSVVAVYTPIPTGPDCSNPLNDPSCEGYWNAIAASTVTDEFTDAVFGDEIEDFYTALVPAPPVVNVTLPEPEVVIELVAEQRLEPPPIIERAPEVVQFAVQDVATPPSEPEPERPRPVESTVESTVERTIDSPIDVQQYALALIATLTTPTAAPSAMSTSVTFETPIAEAFAVSTVATRSTSPVQIAESQEATPLLEQTTKQADVQFEADFNNAIGAGQSIGQFLSAQLPDMTRFDVAPPSQQEQRTTQRATQAMQTMSQQDIAQSTEAQLEEMQESGGFSDQSLTVLLISNNPDFNQYSGLQLQDNAQFYENRVIYGSNRPVDNSRALLLGPGTQIYREMVDAQWQR